MKIEYAICGPTSRVKDALEAAYPETHHEIFEAMQDGEYLLYSVNHDGERVGYVAVDAEYTEHGAELTVEKVFTVPGQKMDMAKTLFPVLVDMQTRAKCDTIRATIERESLAKIVKALGWREYAEHGERIFRYGK